MKKQKKEDRRVKYTKMVLKESLIDLLSQKDISAITIKQICEEADVNRTTFYTHYADQYDLLRQIEDELLQNLKAYITVFKQKKESRCHICGCHGRNVRVHKGQCEIV